MIDSGRIDIEVAWDGAQVSDVRIRSSRPAVSRVLIGRPVGPAIELVPMLFSLCGRAQGLCARLAAEAASGDAPRDQAAMLPALAAEMAFEHLWRLWIDWPGLLGLPVDRAAIAQTGVALRRAASSAEAAQVLAPAIERMLDVDAHAVLEALRGHELSGTGTAWRGVPAMPLAQLRAFLPVTLDAGFAAAPMFDGAPAETGAVVAYAQDERVAEWSRAGAAVAARVAARVVALERCLAVLRGESAPTDWIDVMLLGPDEALARVETARGLLMHRVRVEGGVIADYTIVAPTEWNFHPQGAAVQALVGCMCRDEAALRRHAAALMLALDPCVESRLELVRP